MLGGPLAWAIQPPGPYLPQTLQNSRTQSQLRLGDPSVDAMEPFSFHSVHPRPHRHYSRTAISPRYPLGTGKMSSVSLRTGEAGGSIGTVGQTVGQEGGLRAPAGAARVLRSLGTRVTLGLGGRTICSPGHH